MLAGKLIHLRFNLARLDEEAMSDPGTLGQITPPHNTLRSTESPKEAFSVSKSVSHLID